MEGNNSNVAEDIRLIHNILATSESYVNFPHISVHGNMVRIK
jgi:hypothetical protein